MDSGDGQSEKRRSTELAEQGDRLFTSGSEYYEREMMNAGENAIPALSGRAQSLLHSRIGIIL